jgi:hypothetical protein
MPRFKRSNEGDSEKAIQQAEKHLEEIKSRADEVTEVVRSMRVLRERNHFAERLQALIIGEEVRSS